MKKLILLALGVLITVPVFAVTEDDELIDIIDEYEQEAQEEQFEELNEQLEFSTFSSCEEMGDVLETYIKDNFENFRGGYGYGGGMPLMEREEAVMGRGGDGDMDDAAAPRPGEASQAVTRSSSTDYSTTNIQVEGVDEPDILKSDGDYLYYYSNQLHKLFIINSPLDRQTSMINLDDAQIETIINIPKTFQQVELFVRGDELVILAQRWRQGNTTASFLDRNSRVDVIVYDISNRTDPELVKFSDLDGTYQDARLIDDKLYVVSQLHVNRRYPYMGVDSPEEIELRSDELLPKAIDISYTQQSDEQNLEIGDRRYPYRASVQQAPCEDIYYVLPSKESVEQFGLHPSFTIVRAIDIDTPRQKMETTTAFGNTQTIHMANDALYLTNPIYTSHPFRCPVGSSCILPVFRSGQHTLVHKLGVDAQDGVDYQASSLILGMPLSQYSMSQDNEGYFRILTKTWQQEVATQFFMLDPDLDLEGAVLNIEPGEEFKSSRYIGDKLYLVTFEQTDPLFVIDLEEKDNPEIIGELVIPGFSTYLHPYGSLEDGVQHLLGLGYDTVENQRGGVNTAGIKLDLYKIDYNERDADGHVAVSQVYTETRGGQGSASEATDNPRMFVRDPGRKLVVLPMILQENVGGESCTVETDAQGNVIRRECWPSNRYETRFAGMKGITVDLEDGIEEEFSYDYSDLLKQSKMTYGEERFIEEGGDQIQTWQFQNLNFRVGYLGDVLYALNNIFGHFTTVGTDNEVYLHFDETVTEDGPPARCTYTPPAPDQPVCDMYCGERWVAEEGTCVEIVVDAACSCPGYETQAACEQACLE